MSFTTPPPPLAFSPSQEFIGADGQWSAFVIRVGTPAQNFRVLPSSKSSEIYVPIVDGCAPSRVNFTDCGPQRGAYDFMGRQSSGFLVNATESWRQIGLYEMDLWENLNFTANALYGLDTVGLMLQNSGGPVLSNQVIAAVANPTLWTGMLGLGAKPANFSEFDAPQPGLLSSLVTARKIPSRSYGYTAGAYYRRPQALASLTLGGYDQSKFEDNNVTFGFDPNDDKPTSLYVQSMVAQNAFNGSTNLLDLAHQPVYVTIDYTVPHLWLPESVCDLFASAFHLTYDNTTELYLVNATVHEKLQTLNPRVTIGFGKTADPAGRVNIVLPYAAFDLTATYPIYPTPTKYFPIRRAQNESMYTLGRTFLQEAYLKVDYERGNFSVHQALFPDTNAKQQIVAVLTPASEAQTTTEKGEQGAGKHGLSTGAIVGIVVGDIAAVVLLVVLALWLFGVRRQREPLKPEEPVVEKVVRVDGCELQDDVRHEKDGPAVFEADGNGLVELHYQGLRLNVNVDRSYELSGYGSTPVRITISPSETHSPARGAAAARSPKSPSDARNIVFGDMKGEVPDARRFSFSSQTSTWI
ncbi:acid protease [Bimuria novae-zelandiae CBS 107.79]|uniref:Acid protease n=1 Tax=Bimuria novae-zelandiae CBS 107.79 TaxID=1447943 RepID=A0A6A5VXN3_9PLEO|nr:acid protease [Bimuria novae-zelandiae CBS 107.79]